MNRLSALVSFIVFASVALALWLREPPTRKPDAVGNAAPSVWLENGTVVVAGTGVSLSDVEKGVADASIFGYESERKRYICNANLEIRGSLQMGRAGRPDSHELLEIQTFACGDRRIWVKEGAELSIHYSEIATVSRLLDEKFCSKGYAIVGEGRLEFDHATIAFMSGSVARPACRTASGHIRHSRFIESDGNSFFAEDVLGDGLIMKDSEFLSRGNYGFVVAGPGAKPLRLERCLLRGAAADIHHAGKDAELVLIDCEFRKDAIHFNQLNGIVTVQWTLQVKVVDSRGQPLPGALVHAESSLSCGLEERLAAPVAAGEDGTALLTLTEFVADAFNPRRMDGVNNSTPHRLWVADENGRMLSEKAELEVAAKEIVLTFQISSAPPHP